MVLFGISRPRHCVGKAKLCSIAMMSAPWPLCPRSVIMITCVMPQVERSVPKWNLEEITWSFGAG